MQRTILFVDDEPNVLASLRRMFLDEEYQLFLANSGKEGLTLMQKHEIPVVVSDMRMPVMDGVGFLQQARSIQPDSIRIVLSGYADMDDMRKAINEGGIWRYITKPWDDYDMKLTVRNGFELYESNRDRKNLLAELKRKNEELHLLNEDLERKVARRTAVLDAQNRLLQLVLNDAPIAQILHETCSTVSVLAEATAVCIRTDIPGLCATVGSDIGEPRLTRILAETNVASPVMIERGTAVYPLVRLEALLGVFVVETGRTGERLEEVLQALAPIVSMALMQHRALRDAPGLLGRIDSLMDAL